jgi:hypothetical protein
MFFRTILRWKSSAESNISTTAATAGHSADVMNSGSQVASKSRRVQTVLEEYTTLVRWIETKALGSKTSIGQRPELDQMGTARSKVGINAESCFDLSYRCVDRTVCVFPLSTHER